MKKNILKVDVEMSLKEEIAETLFDSIITLTPEYISKNFVRYKYLNNEDEKFLVRKKADLVLKVIEKRIDSKIQYYKSLSDFRQNNTRIDELEQVKKETLK